MSLGAHLRELRNRLIIAAIGGVIGMVVGFLLTDIIINFITEPIRIVQAERGMDAVALSYNSVTEPFDTRLRMSFAIGILLSAPVWIWQLWAFIVPGLTKKETWYTVGFVGAAIPLFFGGCFTAVTVLPHVIDIMATFTPSDVGAKNWYGARQYYDFVLRFVLIVGCSFVIPLFLVALNFAGLLSGKSIFKGWRWAILIACVFAAVTTPPADLMSMFLVAGVLIVLYFAAGFLSLIVDWRKKKRAIAEGLDPDIAAA